MNILKLPYKMIDWLCEKPPIESLTFDPVQPGILHIGDVVQAKCFYGTHIGNEVRKWMLGTIVEIWPKFVIVENRLGQREAFYYREYEGTMVYDRSELCLVEVRRK